MTKGMAQHGYTEAVSASVQAQGRLGWAGLGWAG